jgi:polar amino acid transport system substrate-binding protein
MLNICFSRLQGMTILGALAMLYTTGVAFSADIAVPDRIKSAGKIVYCTELAFPPWDMIDPDTQQPAGFDIDIGAAVAKAMGVTSEHKNMSFDGLIPALQAKQCDAIISGLYDKPERREVVDFVHYARTGTSIILRTDSDLSVSNLEDLSGKKVAVGIGTSGESTLGEANVALKAAGKPEIEIVALQTSGGAFQQLSAGLVDAYLGSTDQAGYYNKQKPGSVKLGGAPVVSFPTGIATLHSSKDLHEAIEAAMKEIRANGEYDKVIATWGFEALAVP